MAERQTQTLTQTADAVHRQPRIVAFDDLEIRPKKKGREGGCLKKATMIWTQKHLDLFVTNSPQISYQYK